MNEVSGDSGCALLVTSQICDSSGVRRSDPQALELLRLAAREVADRRDGLLNLPGTVAADGVLSLTASSPEAVVEIILSVAAATRPEHTTFCVTLAATDSTLRERSAAFLARTPTSELEAAVLGAHAADASARAGLSETDHRDSRVRVLAPAPAHALGAALGLLLEAYDAMTDRQRHIIQLVKASRTQQDVATHLGISRQAVNQSLSSARWTHLDGAARAIAASLTEFCDTPPRGRERGSES